METRAQYVLVGAFTVLVAAAGLLFCLWVARSGHNRDIQLYDIVFQENVSGLSVGNAVQYSGIRVGEVKDLWLDTRDPRRVWARVGIYSNTPVREDTRARLMLANVTGTTNIQLTSGSPDSPPLKIREGEEFPRIEAEPSPFAKLKIGSEELFTRINMLIDSANRLLSEENAGNVTAFLEHLNTISATLAGQREEIRDALKSLAAAGNQARDAADSAAKTLRQANDLLANQGKTLLTDANKTMASLERSSLALENLVKSNKNALNSGIQGLADLGPAIRELRSALASIRKIAQRLDEDPASYLMGRDRIKEFKR